MNTKKLEKEVSKLAEQLNKARVRQETLAGEVGELKAQRVELLADAEVGTAQAIDVKKAKGQLGSKLEELADVELLIPKLDERLASLNQQLAQARQDEKYRAYKKVYKDALPDVKEYHEALLVLQALREKVEAAQDELNRQNQEHAFVAQGREILTLIPNKFRIGLCYDLAAFYQKGGSMNPKVKGLAFHPDFVKE
jgi:chromosome segregation ATPase